MTDQMQQQPRRRGVYIAARADFDFLTPLERAAKMVDRTPAHFARQLIIHGFYRWAKLINTERALRVHARVQMN
jgi:hypothetical protein